MGVSIEFKDTGFDSSAGLVITVDVYCDSVANTFIIY